MTTTVLNTKTGEAENKAPDTIGLVKKAHYNTKVSDNELNYFTTSNENKFTKEVLDGRIKEKKISW